MNQSDSSAAGQPLTSRRTALKGLAAMATVQILPSYIALGGPKAPSNQLTKGIIGCGGISRSHLGMPGKLLALCDVDSKRLSARQAEAKKRGDGDVEGYSDFRELIARKDIDIVHVATPPHWHAIQAIAAVKAGKDVWCEKPMSRTIGEGQAMVKAVTEHEKIFRINTWFRFQSRYYGLSRPASEAWKVVHHKLLGDGPYTFNLGTAFVGNWKLGQWSGKTNLKEQEIPKHLDYNMWLGPAPMKPYNAHRVHGSFRGYWDYDGGGLGDMGQHYLDPCQFVLGKDNESPVSVEVDTQKQHHDAVLPWRRIELVYADGTKIILNAENKPEEPIITGPKGSIYRHFRTKDVPDLDKKLKELPGPPPVITDFHQAVRERKKFALNEQNGFRSSTIINIAKVALRLGKPLKFDSDKLQFIDDIEANKLINQPMRGPWKI
ncbi:MAG TPA: oxidoreductase [Verrucomicrobiales bacterium]|jgi:predicted dehydrogenase|nr:oxidoreductase [Verrucomicrobiales bacterium]